MAKFLIAVWPLQGHINPTLAIAHGLADLGHDVTFYTGGDVQAMVEGEGFAWVPFKRVSAEVIKQAEHPSAYSSSILDQIRALRQMKAGLQEWLVGTVPGQVEDLEEVFEDRDFDVILTETAMWGPLLVMHELHGIPVAVFSTFAACLLPGPDAPAWGRGLPRPSNRLMRFGSRLQRKVMWWLSAGFRAAANSVRRDYGLAPLTVTVTEFAGSMPLYLMPSVPEFDYQRSDLPASVRYVGTEGIR